VGEVEQALVGGDGISGQVAFGKGDESARQGGRVLGSAQGRLEAIALRIRFRR